MRIEVDFVFCVCFYGHFASLQMLVCRGRKGKSLLKTFSHVPLNDLEAPRTFGSRLFVM